MQLSEDQKKIVQEILEYYVSDSKILIFGSRATDTASPLSDLDILIKDKNKIALQLLAEIVEAFDESELPFTVDIIDWHRITTEFQQEIDRESVKLPLAD